MALRRNKLNGTFSVDFDRYIFMQGGLQHTHSTFTVIIISFYLIYDK